MMSINNIKVKKSILGAAVVIGLYGCGGSGSDDAGAQSQSVSLSGQAADGYLVNANVCLDLNDNKVCDSGEPFAVTTSNGEFTLTGLSQSEVDSHGIVVQVIKNVTVDEDNPGVTIDGDYSLTAPVGYTFVSPITTMVQNQLDNLDDGDVEEAEEAIKALLGLDIDPALDYVAQKQASGADAIEQKAYEQLHQVAQVAAEIMKQTQAAFEADPSAEDGISETEKLEWIAEQIVEDIETIATQVIEDDDTSLSVDELLSNIGSDITVDVTQAKSEIEVKRELQVASASDLLNVVTGDGVFSYSAWHSNSYLQAYYNNFKLSVSSDVSGAYEEAGKEYQYDGSGWVERTDDGDNYILTSTGWKDVNEDYFISMDDTTGQVTLTHPTYTEITERFIANKVELQGKNIATVLSMTDRGGYKWAHFVDDTADFSDAESFGYQMEFIQLYDRYELWQHICESSELTEGVCYQVWQAGPNGTYASTVNELISASEAATPSHATGPSISPFLIEGTEMGFIFSELVDDAGKTANFYVIEQDGEGYMDHNNAFLLARGNWELRQVYGENILVVHLPPSVSRYTDDRDPARIFAMRENADGVNMVHSGEFRPANSSEEQEMIFNNAAHDEIMAAFSHSQFCEFQANSVMGTASGASSECSAP